MKYFKNISLEEEKVEFDKELDLFLCEKEVKIFVENNLIFFITSKNSCCIRREFLNEKVLKLIKDKNIFKIWSGIEFSLKVIYDELGLKLTCKDFFEILKCSTDINIFKYCGMNLKSSLDNVREYRTSLEEFLKIDLVIDGKTEKIEKRGILAKFIFNNQKIFINKELLNCYKLALENDKLEIPYEEIKKIYNQYNFNDEIINLLGIDEGPNISLTKIRKIKGLNKKIDKYITFLEETVKLRELNSKFNCNFIITNIYQFKTNTGRFVMKSPNLLNLSKIKKDKNENIKEYFFEINPRALIKSNKNNLFINADFINEEVTILANLSKCPKMINILKENENFFEVFQKEIKSFDLDLEKSVVKKIIYGLMYGMGIKKMTHNIFLEIIDGKVSRDKNYFLKKYEEALNISQNIFKYINSEFKEIIKWQKDIYKFSKEKGYIYSKCMRRVSTNEMSYSQIINFPIQTTASEVLKYFVCELWIGGIKDESFKIMNQDEILLEINESNIEETKKIINRALKKTNDFFEFIVPLKLDVKIKKTWGWEMKDIQKYVDVLNQENDIITLNWFKKIIK